MLRPNVDQRKSEILEAAVQVIIDVGFTEMTVADVAKVAGGNLLRAMAAAEQVSARLRMTQAPSEAIQDDADR